MTEFMEMHIFIGFFRAGIHSPGSHLKYIYWLRPIVHKLLTIFSMILR